MPRTLLLADDSVTIRRVIELTFTDENVRVVSVSSGREAIERMEGAGEKPDIVLADIGMADVSGYDIAAYIKGRPDLRHIPVVLLAGAFEPLDEARARQAGSDGVLVKPFEPQMVVARVRELLGARPSAAVQPPAGAYGIAPPSARTAAASRTLDSFDPEPPRAASSNSAATDPLFDKSLDQLDAAFGDTQPPRIDEAVVSDFAQDLKDLRSGKPEPGFGHDDFGDWDLPSRGAAAEEPRAPRWDEPARTPVIEPAAVPAPAPVTLPPPVTLEARPVLAVTPMPRPEPAPPVFARPSAPPPLAEAFSSLLAAEEGRPHQAPAFPAYDPGPAPSAAPAALSDDEIERIADRVIVKLGANVRGTVIDLAASLVRAEIDRLKAIR